MLSASSVWIQPDGPKIRESPGFKFIATDKSLPLDEIADAFILWNVIVQTCAKCLLTKNTDKLIAISPIAKQFQSILKDDYNAGVWRRHLAQHLLWNVSSEQTPVRSPASIENYCAPSWSWASVEGPITAYSSTARHDRPFMIQILDVQLQSRTADPMGPLSGGHIKVRGWLKQFPPPYLPEDSSDDGENNTEFWQLKITGSGDCYAKIDQLPLPADRNWYCLPILATVMSNILGDDEKKVLGLMLLATENKGEYRRVGTFEAL